MPFKSGAITEFRGVQDELTDADLAPFAQGALALILLRKSMDVHEDNNFFGQTVKETLRNMGNHRTQNFGVNHGPEATYLWQHSSISYYSAVAGHHQFAGHSLRFQQEPEISILCLTLLHRNVWMHVKMWPFVRLSSRGAGKMLAR